MDNNSLTGCAGLSMPGPDLVYKFTVFPGNDLTFTLAPETNGMYDPGLSLTCPFDREFACGSLKLCEHLCRYLRSGWLDTRS